MYYGMIALSVLMFSTNFVFSRQYRQRMGSGFFQTFLLSFIGSVAGLISMTLISTLQNGRLSIEFSWFAFIMALTSVANGLLLNYCSLRTLGVVNLSMYSIIMMLGGMVLPSVVGVVFFDEGMTVAKGVCYALITVSLLLTLEKSDKKGGFLWYVGVFVLNGMSGVITKIFNAAPYTRISAAGYSFLTAICNFTVSGLLVLLLYRNFKGKISFTAIGYGFAGGGINRIANFLLVAALAHVPASVQYPMVTGGVMIVSTVIAFFTSSKPTNRQIASVILSFIGIVLLVTIPI